MLSDRERIANMLLSIEKVMQLTRNKTEEHFLGSWEMQDLCCFHLSLIGENAGRLSDEVKSAYPNIPWRAVASMRNVIVHDYGQVDYHIVWQSIIADLPVLKDVLEAMKH